MGNYYSLIAYFLTVVMVALLLILLVLLLVQQRPSRKKLMSYECGFEPFNDARKPFYINFYNIGLAFLLFDVEIMLILPGVYALGIMPEMGVYCFLFFCSVLALGYTYELVAGSFKIRK